MTIQKLIPLLLINVIGAVMMWFGLHGSDPILFWCGFGLFMIIYIVLLVIFLYQEIRRYKIKKCSNVIRRTIKDRYKKLIDGTNN